MPLNYTATAPARETIDAHGGPVIVQFGANWCEYCQGAQPLIDVALDHYPELQVLMIEDGRGRPLGRSFQIKLWPTLVFLQSGREVARVVRPDTSDEVQRAIARLLAGCPGENP